MKLSRVLDFMAAVGGAFCCAYLVREAAWGYVAFAAIAGAGLGVAELRMKARHGY